MTADRVHASVGALQALSRSLATYRAGFDESARAVERSLAASSDEADEPWRVVAVTSTRRSTNIGAPRRGDGRRKRS